MRRRIFWGVLLASGVSLLIGLTAAAVIRQQQISANRAELNRQAVVTANLVSSEIGPNLRADDRGAIPEILSQIRMIGDYDYLEVGLVNATRIVSLLRDPVLLPELRTGTTDGNDRVRQLSIAGTPVFAATRTIDVGNVRLLIAIGREEPLLAAGAFTRPLVVGLVVGVLLALAISALLSRRLSSRLAGLEEAAVDLAGGDYRARAPVEGADDLAELGSTFNYMASSLEHAQHRERDFLMSVGHDLRTPLTTIRGYAEALDAGVIEPDEFPRVAEVLHRQTDRLSRLVEDLMLLARLQAREFTLRPEPVDLAAHIREQAEAHQVRAEKLGVRFEADVPRIGVVEVDPDRMAQIVGNLVDNALRYTPEQGSVALAMRATEQGVEVSVADTGPGIDEQDIPRVFERLYVAQRYRPLRPEGSGLGLSIVKELVDAMQGEVTVTSRPGHGTRVTVSLPLGHAIG